MNITEVDCPVCGHNYKSVLYQDTLRARPPVFGYKWTPEVRLSYQIVTCTNCGHCFCSPRADDIYKYYTDVADESYLLNSELRLKTANHIIQDIVKLAPRGRLIDIGCSTGDFLSVASKFYEAEGIELSDWAFKLACEKGLKVKKHEIQQLVTNAEKYDVATMWGVIEHLENPKEDLINTNRILNTGGIICLWTGDISSIWARIFRQKWWYILGQHIQYFSRKSLAKLMSDCGFECVSDNIYPYVISMGYLGTSLSRYPIIGPIANWVLKQAILRDRCITLKLSSEIFGIYRKVKNV